MDVDEQQPIMRIVLPASPHVI